jgi:membrane-bound lytic murein transglycosylase MltF
MKSRRLLVVYVFLLLVASGGMYLLRKTSRTEIPVRDYPAIEEEGVLRILTEYSTQGYHITGDTIEGFQYELSRAIAEISGLEVQTRLETSLHESFKALENNVCDIIAENIPVTSELRESYLFTDPLVLSKQALVQRTAKANAGTKPIRNHLYLAGKTIYIPKASPALLRLEHLEHEMGDSIFVVEDDTCSSEQLAVKVAKGEIDYAVCDQNVALALKNEFPEIDIDTDISFTQLQAWAIRKDSPVLLDSLNSWFGRLRKNGRFDKIYKRYYSATN